MTGQVTETSPDLQSLERAVAGRYALERELGRGGMGVVLLARDLSLERPVALKLLPAVMAEMRLRELEVARTLVDAGGAPLIKHLDGASPSRRVTSGTGAATSQDTLEIRRNILLDEMRDTLEKTQTRRATLAAALENVRIQLLRIGAGMGTPDDMREEVAVLSALVESSSP